MNRLPSPFASNLPTIMTPQNTSSSSSPGFLAITRPPSASSDHSGRIKSMGRGRSRGNHWSNYSPQEHRGHYSNNSFSGFNSVRHQGNYLNRTPYRRNPNTQHNFRTPSPNTNFINYRNTSLNHSNMQSTPNSSGKKLFKSEKFRNNKNTPLKSIPIEKFVSANMVKEPWGNFQVESMPRQNSSIEDCLDEVASLSESQSGTDSPSPNNSDVESDQE